MNVPLVEAATRKNSAPQQEQKMVKNCFIFKLANYRPSLTFAAGFKTLS
jgi:hypothetical protein